MPRGFYGFTLAATDAEGRALAGVQLFAGQKAVVSSQADRPAPFGLPGIDGATAHLRVVCPTGHRPQEPKVNATLREYADGSIPSLSAVCISETARLALVVTAPQAAGLPLQRRGRTLAHLDAHGTAHVLVEGRPGESVEVSIDTSSRRDLRPVTPGAKFDLDEGEQVALFQPRMRRLLPRPKPKPRRIKPRLPVKIRAHGV